MKKLFMFLAVALLSLSLTSCEYDDSDLWGAVDDLEQQVTANTEDIATLSALVEAMNQGKVITSVDYTDEGVVLTFSDNTTVTIKNGKDGADGKDGQDGVDGKDGADGKDGKDGADGKDGDSFFVSIEETETTVIITLADGRQIILPKVEVRVLTFEDKDYKGSASNAESYWSDLISSSEYGNGNGRDSWCDEGNTELAFYPSSTALFPGYGGHAISNYVGDDLSQGNYMHDLQAYAVEGGANGSENFAVHFGYLDDSGMGMQDELIYFEFDDGVARTIDHMYVTNTTYVYNILANGDGWMVPSGGVSEDCWFKIIAYGYDEDDNQTATAEFILWDKGRKGVKEWTKWDLSSLGKVARVEFNLVGSEELYESGYGLGAPGYFAYDDVAVIFE